MYYNITVSEIVEKTPSNNATIQPSTKSVHKTPRCKPNIISKLMKTMSGKKTREESSETQSKSTTKKKRSLRKMFQGKRRIFEDFNASRLTRNNDSAEVDDSRVAPDIDATIPFEVKSEVESRSGRTPVGGRTPNPGDGVRHNNVILGTPNAQRKLKCIGDKRNTMKRKRTGSLFNAKLKPLHGPDELDEAISNTVSESGSKVDDVSLKSKISCIINESRPQIEGYLFQRKYRTYISV